MYANLPIRFGKTLIFELLLYFSESKNIKTTIVSLLNNIISEMIDRYGRNIHRVTDDSFHDFHDTYNMHIFRNVVVKASA